jgi:hypothetical protein
LRGDLSRCRADPGPIRAKLLCTLQKIGFGLYSSAYRKAGILVFEKPGGGYGFPIPKNGRDLLIGNDKIFDR